MAVVCWYPAQSTEPAALQWAWGMLCWNYKMVQMCLWYCSPPICTFAACGETPNIHLIDEFTKFLRCPIHACHFQSLGYGIETFYTMAPNVGLLLAIAQHSKTSVSTHTVLQAMLYNHPQCQQAQSLHLGILCATSVGGKQCLCHLTTEQEWADVHCEKHM